VEKEKTNLSGFRAPYILEVIGEALKKRLCLIDLSEMLEDEEADGENKFRRIKEMNRRILN
jgi:hypothetical protein